MDPFASIIKFCIPTAEMEAKFASCPYARESEILFPPGSSTSVDQQPERHCNSSSSSYSNPKRSSSMVRVSRLRLESERVEVVVLDEGETEAIVIDDDDEEENVKDISNGRGSGKKPKGRHADVDADADFDFDGRCKRRRVRQRGDICGKKRDLPAWGKGIGEKVPSASLKKKKKRMEKEVVVENEKEKEECSSDELFELEVLKVVFDDDGGSCYCDDEYVDLILTAQEMGVELIRPRWWPPADADADADGDHPDLWILWC